MRVLVVHRKCPSILLRLCCSVDANSFIIYSRRDLGLENRGTSGILNYGW